MWDTLLPEAVTPSPRFQLKLVGVVPLDAVAVKTTVPPTCGFVGDQEKLTVLLSLQAVKGWSSHPLKSCHVALRLSGSQKMKP